MRKLQLLLLLFFFGTLASAQVPAGYYNAAVGKSGEELRTALYNIIKTHNAVDYGYLWTAFQSTDKMESGYVWDIYSDVPGGTAAYYFAFGTNQCGSYSQEGNCYNREHTVPQSWFGDAVPMKTDLFHIYPTDGWVNNKRANFPYGTVASPTWTSTNGSKLGPCSYPGCSGTAFEPIDAYKGDLARGFFYMSVCYKDKNLGQTDESVFSGSELVAWARDMFVAWHEADPVSEKEINRNNVIYNNIQHNRNPFIDCPELVDYLFGSRTNEPWYPTCVDWIEIPENEMFTTSCSLYPNPAAGNVTIESSENQIITVEICDLTGRELLSREGIGACTCQMDLGDLSAGTYFVKVKTLRTVEVMKLVVR